MKRVEKTHLPVAALTHPGMKGKNNEDRFGVTAFRTDGKQSVSVLLAVLSDGIGGNRAGEVASELTVNLISQFAADSDGQDPIAILGEAIRYASDQIHQQAQQNIEQHGMGATCACAWIAGDRLYTATVGDSRIYLMRGDTIRQLSIDHTWIQEALERGLLQPDQVEGHPNAHVIRRYLGSPTPPDVDFRVRADGDAQSANETGQGMPLLPGDRLLLCSDGLTDLVNDEEILEVFRRETLEAAGHHLIEMANERGGHDNITLVAVQIPGMATMPVAVRRPARARSLSRMLIGGCLGVVLLAAIVGGLAGSYMLYFNRDNPTSTPTVTMRAAPTRARTATRGPVVTRTPTATATSATPAGPSPTPPPPGAFPSVTPIRIGSQTPPLPVVTVAP